VIVKGILKPSRYALLLVWLVSACTSIQTGQTPPVVDQGVQSTGPVGQADGRTADTEPRAPVAQQPPAVLALLDRAEHQANAGDLGSAAATLERAIRIDSRNPVLWHHLASVRFAEGEFVQAENLAAKSNSLAPGNRALQIRNWLLIADARRSRGDSAGASAAEQRVRTLEAD
jgi:Flp pilus assembly protein TadD